MAHNRYAQTKKTLTAVLLATALIAPGLAAAQNNDQAADANQNRSDAQLAMNTHFVDTLPHGLVAEINGRNVDETNVETSRHDRRAATPDLSPAANVASSQLLKRQSPFASVGY